MESEPDGHCIAETARCLLHVLADDVLLRICRFLPAEALLNTGTACAELQQRTKDSVELWKALCEFLIGQTALLLHERCWIGADGAVFDSSFYRRLFKSAWACDSFCYDHEVRKDLLQSLHNGEDPPDKEVFAEFLTMSGHRSEALGSLVMQIGGMRNDMRSDDLVKITVLNLAERRILRPRLAESSDRPEHRMRHATCVVKAPYLPDAVFSEAVLVLGGHATPVNGGAQPRGCVRSLLFLQMTKEDGSEVRWHTVPASGTAPENIYNHECAAFAGGKRVCMFGGDIPQDDPEFFRINDRQNASFVYVLDVTAQQWDICRTTGPGPSWRSFHAAVAHTSWLDAYEYMVTFGGTDEHCDPLTGGRPADMRGYQLDLNRFHWRQGPGGGFSPGERIRFGTARWGRHLIVHGGHGQAADEPYVVRLNLTTLKWAAMNFTNSPPPLPHGAFETGAPQVGVVVGGAQGTRRGPKILTRLVVFRLADPLAAASEGGEPDASSMSDDESEDETAMARVQFMGRDGQTHVLQMPAIFLTAMQNRAGSRGELLALLQHLWEDRQQTRGD